MIKSSRILVGEAKVGYIRYVPEHLGSTGESAPWCVCNHDTDKILKAYQTREQAKSSLGDMHASDSV